MADVFAFDEKPAGKSSVLNREVNKRASGILSYLKALNRVIRPTVEVDVDEGQFLVTIDDLHFGTIVPIHRSITTIDGKTKRWEYAAYIRNDAVESDLLGEYDTEEKCVVALVLYYIESLIWQNIEKDECPF